MEILNIEYSDDFEAFLASLQDVARVSVIRNALNEFAKGELDLDPRECAHIENRTKVAIGDANVVVYYDLKDNTMIVINGSVIHQRAA